jgi:hypothetical protein
MTVFPQYALHFHKNNAREPLIFRRNCEYLTNQRRRNLPVGESRQGPSRESATRLNEAFRKLDAYGWNRESSYSECDNGRGLGIAGSARRYRTILKEQSVVIWKPNQIFDKSDRRGEISKETRPFALWANAPHPLKADAFPGIVALPKTFSTLSVVSASLRSVQWSGKLRRLHIQHGWPDQSDRQIAPATVMLGLPQENGKLHKQSTEECCSRWLKALPSRQ